MFSRRRALAFCAGVAATAAGVAGQGGRAEDIEVDLALVLAVDCSYSVDEREFRLQMEGMGLALKQPDVRRAMRSGDRGRIAVAVFQWSNASNRQLVVPWTVLAGGQETIELGDQIMRLPRSLAQGGTSISSALLFADALLIKGPKAERRVIDISSDGRNNTGVSVTQVRDEVVAQGIIINGIVILNEWPTLDKYFETEVVGGKGHFIVAVENYDDYADAIHRKLLREIIGPGMS
jgi:hypothetical protein